MSAMAELKQELPEAENGVMVGPDADSTYWGEIEKSEFLDLIGTIQNEANFNVGVLNFFANHKRKDLYPYITDVHGRSLWHRFIEKGGSGTAIDLGAGMGAISEYLSRNYQQVYAVEGCRERCDFLALRKKLNGLANLNVVHNNIYSLPFRNGSADLIACNGVLEWAGLNRAGNVRTIQRDFLKEAGRVLKDNGLLYVGIENRYARVYFKGKVKDHSGLNYTSLVPRWMASWMCRREAASGFSISSRFGAYRTYTYSMLGYRALLKQAGFKYLHFVCAEPSYDLPRSGFPIETPLNELGEFARTFGLPDLTKWVRRYLCSNFFIFASRQPLEGRVVNRPRHFGYFDTMRIETETIHRTDCRGNKLVESIIKGSTLLKPEDPTVTTAELIAAYDNSKSRVCVSTPEEFEGTWKHVEKLLAEHVDRATLLTLHERIRRDHLNRPFHGDFWLGNLVRDESSKRLVLIDPEWHAFGSPQLDAVDFVLDLSMNDRLKTFTQIDPKKLCAHFGFDPADRDLMALSIIRQIIRYSPFHRSDRQVYRFIDLLNRWTRDSAVNLLAAA